MKKIVRTIYKIWRNLPAGLALLAILPLLGPAARLPSLWACNSFSHQWSLTGLEEETDRLPVLATHVLLRSLPERLASASTGMPWFQTASSVLLLGIDAATDTIRADLAAIASGENGRDRGAGHAGHGPAMMFRAEPGIQGSESYELLQRTAAETGRCTAMLQVVAGYRSLSHFIDLLPIRLGTIRSQVFERIEVLVRIAGPRGEIGLVGPLKAEVTLSVDTRLNPGNAYVGRLEWHPDHKAAALCDLTTMLTASAPVAAR